MQMVAVLPILVLSYLCHMSLEFTVSHGCGKWWRVQRHSSMLLGAQDFWRSTRTGVLAAQPELS